jgi:hypothetical protein
VANVTLHLHIWKPGPDQVEPEVEVNLEWDDTYDDHFQFIGQLPDGRTLELRLLKKDLKKLEVSTVADELSRKADRQDR